MIPTREQLLAVASLSPAARREVFANPRNFLLFFAYYFLDYVHYPFAQFHADLADDFADLVDGIITELVVVTGREFAKSSMERAMILCLIANKWARYPNQTSYDRENAEGVLYDVVVEMQTNKRFIEDYGQLFNSTRNRNEEKQSKRTGNFVTETNIRVEAHTVAEPVRGRLHDGQRPDWNFHDDIENNKTVRSEAAMRETMDYLSEMRGGLDQKRARTVFFGNWLSNEGVMATLKKKCLDNPKSRYREVWRVDPSTGKPSWPGRDVLTDAELLLPGNENKISIETKMREMRSPDTGDADYLREYQGVVYDELGDGIDSKGYYALFPAGFLKYSDGFTFHAPATIGVDPSGEGNDYTRIVVTTRFQSFIYATEHKSTPKSVAALVLRAMDEYSVPAQCVVIDSFGVGSKTVSELNLMGHRVLALNVGEHVVIDDRGVSHMYQNDRAYMYQLLRDRIAQGHTLVADPIWEKERRTARFLTAQNGKMKMKPKLDIKKSGLDSPDALDACALSMLVDPVAVTAPPEPEPRDFDPSNPFSY